MYRRLRKGPCVIFNTLAIMCIIHIFSKMPDNLKVKVKETVIRDNKIEPILLTTNMTKRNSSIPAHEVQRNTSTFIFEHSFSYLHVPSGICMANGAQADPFLLIVIKSDINRIGHRMAIRTTWGTVTPGIKTVFLLGYSPLMKPFIQMESNIYKDIIQETFLDDYRNNTEKTIMGFKWVSSQCMGAKYVFFVDDDYIVNIKYLWDHLHRLNKAGNRTIYTGFKWINAKPQRNPTSKWYVSKFEYPEETWPPYFTGGSMILSPDVVRKISDMVKFVKPLFIDDVYLGIIAKKLGLFLEHDSRFFPTYRPDRMAYLFSSHGFQFPNNLINDWNKFKVKFDMVI